MTGNTPHLFAVIMAGGRGERFWPAGRQEHPKQLLPLLGETTMIEETVQRLFPMLAPEQILVITNLAYVDQVRDLLPVPAENVIGEPEGRDTAPCVALATALVARRDPEATVIVLPADHVIRPAKIFQDTLLAAVRIAQTGTLVTFGITPTRPATGYGYIYAGEPVADGFRKILAFKEKPDVETAEGFSRDGNFKWNNGMFIWRVDTIAEAFRRYAPSLSAKLEDWQNGGDYRRNFAEQPVGLKSKFCEKNHKSMIYYQSKKGV